MMYHSKFNNKITFNEIQVSRIISSCFSRQDKKTTTDFPDHFPCHWLPALGWGSWIHGVVATQVIPSRHGRISCYITLYTPYIAIYVAELYTIYFAECFFGESPFRKKTTTINWLWSYPIPTSPSTYIDNGDVKIPWAIPFFTRRDA